MIQTDYITKIKEKFSIGKINTYIERLSNLHVLAIGDTIIDHYLFVDPKGRATKDPILSVRYVNEEIYPGGILAIANNMGDFVKKIKLVTLIGDSNSMLDFIQGSLNKNIEFKMFIKENSPTIVKKRIVDYYRNNKLFKIEYINDKPITDSLTREILDYLDEELPKYDLVIVGDFGHGFINDSIKRKLEEKSKFLALNVQSNSANRGYNYFTLYKRKDFISMNEEELRLPLLKRFEDIEQVMAEAHNLNNINNFLITQGKNGSIFFINGHFFKAPAFIEHAKDTIGAGDALFALSSLFVYLKAENEIIPFIANCAGGIAANILGHKEFITKEKLLNFIKGLYENGME